MDIHSPTIPSSGQQETPLTHNGDSTEGLFALMREKDCVEAELKALGSVLDSHKVNMKTSLTTFDGYPRDDIDIPQIRITRTRIIRLRNDYKDLMNQIEAGLHAHHAAVAASPEAGPTSASSSGVAGPSTAEIQAPFAKINAVAPNSPAAEAGMQVGDYIKRFGSVNALNHEKLRKLTELVSINEGKPLSVLLSRAEAGSTVDREVTITPRLWAGTGKLGCHILPV